MKIRNISGCNYKYGSKKKGKELAGGIIHSGKMKEFDDEIASGLLKSFPDHFVKEDASRG